MKFSLGISSHLLKKSLMENFIFEAAFTHLLILLKAPSSITERQS